MLDSLRVINIKANSNSLQSISSLCESDCFILKTCQRTLIVSIGGERMIAPNSDIEIDYFAGLSAYIYLLETICGLKSKLIGENEIAGQFKNGYEEYKQKKHRSPILMNILEKLFKDAKSIRAEFLSNIGQQSYSGLARRVLEKAPAKEGTVLITGSGALSKDLLKLLSKRYQITICARNLDRIDELKESFPLISILPFERVLEATNYSHIVNTIGAEEVIFDETFFNAWASKNSERIFIDLANPSVIKTEYRINESVYRLEDLFLLGQKLDFEKEAKVQLAKQAITRLAQKRSITISFSSPFGWEDLQFA